MHAGSILKTNSSLEKMALLSTWILEKCYAALIITVVIRAVQRLFILCMMLELEYQFGDWTKCFVCNSGNAASSITLT